MHLENLYPVLEDIVLFVFKEKKSIRKTEISEIWCGKAYTEIEAICHIPRWFHGNRQPSQITESVYGARGTRIISSESSSLLLHETSSLPLSKRLLIDLPNLSLLSRLVKWFRRSWSEMRNSCSHTWELLKLSHKYMRSQLHNLIQNTAEAGWVTSSAPIGVT